MEVDRPRTYRTVSLVLQLAALAAVAAGLADMLVGLVGLAGQRLNPAQQRLVLRMAWLSGAVLCLTTVLVLWTGIRLLKALKGLPRRHGPTPYVNAWALAGKRIVVDDDDEGGDAAPGDET